MAAMIAGGVHARCTCGEGPTEVAMYIALFCFSTSLVAACSLYVHNEKDHIVMIRFFEHLYRNESN